MCQKVLLFSWQNILFKSLLSNKKQQQLGFKLGSIFDKQLFMCLLMKQVLKKIHHFLFLFQLILFGNKISPSHAPRRICKFGFSASASHCFRKELHSFYVLFCRFQMKKMKGFDTTSHNQKNIETSTGFVLPLLSHKADRCWCRNVFFCFKQNIKLMADENI